MLKKQFLQRATRTFLNLFQKEISKLIKDTNITAKQFAVCGEYLFRANKKYRYPAFLVL